MKPVVIYQKTNEQYDSVCISKEEFEKYLSDAYLQGLSDGTPKHIYIPPHPGYGGGTYPYTHGPIVICGAG